MFKQSSKYYRSDYCPCKDGEGICLLYDKRICKFVGFRYYPKGERLRIKGRYVMFTSPFNWDYVCITLGSIKTLSSDFENFCLSRLSDSFIEVV